MMERSSVLYNPQQSEDPRGSALAVRQADTDAQVVDLWLRSFESHNTRRNYRRHADAFLAQLAGEARGLTSVRIGDVHDYSDRFKDRATTTRANATNVVKSLLSFAQEIGYAQFNPGKAVKAPPVKARLAERIMSETDALLLVARKAAPRDMAIVALIYGAGLRRQEVCDLRWIDLVAREDAGQVTVMGKGGKTRVVLLSPNVWRTVTAIRGHALVEAAVFPSRKGGGKLDPATVWRVVKAAVAAAGLPSAVSTHWLRHAHASHSLDRGAPIHLVQATLGHASVATTGIYLHARPSDSSGRYLAI